MQMVRSRDGLVLELGSASDTSQSTENDALRRELGAAKLEIERLHQLLAGETNHDSVEAEQTKAAKPAKKSKRKKKPKRQADVEHHARVLIDQHLGLSSDTSQDKLIVM